MMQCLRYLVALDPAQGERQLKADARIGVGGHLPQPGPDGDLVLEPLRQPQGLFAQSWLVIRKGR